jgi:hypothetical protein
MINMSHVRCLSMLALLSFAGCTGDKPTAAPEPTVATKPTVAAPPAAAPTPAAAPKPATATPPTAAPKATGGCSESDRKTIVFKTNYAFTETLKSCSSLKGLDEKCVKLKYPAITESCLDCFEKMTSCAVANCKGKCWMSPRGKECAQCSVDHHCVSAMEKCSGVKSANLPGFKP